MSIKENIKKVRERIADAALKCGRKPDEILLMGVTKTRTVDEIEEALNYNSLTLKDGLYLDLIGENRVQEAMEKKSKLNIENLKLNLIGHLQANKARKAVEIFDMIQSIDSPEIAERVDKISLEFGKIMPVLIEINTSGEASKTGVNPEKFYELLDNVLKLKNLRLEGLMTVGPISDDEKIIRSSFAMLRKFAEEARSRSGLELKILSMGMSDDFEYAVMEGSTQVRIGSLIFGSRSGRF